MVENGLSPALNGGKSPTAQTIDGVTIDLNRVSRFQFREFLRLLQEAETDFERDALTGEFYQQVITTWPFGEHISKAAYLDLPLLDSKRVDDAFTKATEIITKKNSTS